MKLGYSESTGQYFDMDTGQPVNAAAAEASPMEAFLVNAGEQLSNIPGMDKIFGPMPEGNTGMADLEAVNPVASFAGDVAPSMVGPVKAGLVGQGIYGTLQGAALADENERGVGAVLGAAGTVVGDMAGRVVGRLRNMVKASQSGPGGRVQQELLEGGYQLTPAQKSGSDAAMRIERSAEKTAQGQKITGAMREANQDQLQRVANQAIGLGDVPNPIDRNARELAAEAIGKQMDQAAAGVDVDMSKPLVKRIKKIIKNDDMLELPEIKEVGKEGTVIAGKDYMRIRSDLARAQRSAQGSTRDYISNTVSQLDEEFLNVASPEQAAMYRQAREQYKNLIQLEKGQALSTDGLVNPKSLSNAMKSRTGYGARGTGNLLDESRTLIRDAENLSSRSINPMIGNSGTPEGLNNLFSPQELLRSWAASKYYGGSMGMGGLLEKAPQAYPGLGANIGRGLLNED